jgi:hypothetical protein
MMFPHPRPLAGITVASTADAVPASCGFYPRINREMWDTAGLPPSLLRDHRSTWVPNLVLPVVVGPEAHARARYPHGPRSAKARTDAPCGAAGTSAGRKWLWWQSIERPLPEQRFVYLSRKFARDRYWSPHLSTSLRLRPGVHLKASPVARLAKRALRVQQ